MAHTETKSKGAAAARAHAAADEPTFCDIMGEWGLYQWSICLFATLYSALFGVTVVVGPIWTPEMEHVCALDGELLLAEQLATTPSPSNLTSEFLEAGQRQLARLGAEQGLHECAKTINLQRIQCSRFIYNDGHYGRLLTNSFDLVCDRAWLRSLVSSSALAGMLASSVTLGLVSDKLGRLRCIRIGFYLALAANLVALLAHSYSLLNVCIFLMSYGQVGAANALCTLLMEATSPRLRIVAIFEYGLGWGLGVALVPLLNELTHDYRWFLGALLALQLLMAPWLHLGIFESIRWLLSEGHVNRAQIELGRACRINRVETSARLAQSIAHIQLQQVHRASRIIDDEAAPERLARALDSELSQTTRELDLLSAAIRSSFGLIEASEEAAPAPAGAQQDRKCSTASRGRRVSALKQEAAAAAPLAHALNNLAELSPTLARKSFSVSIAPPPAQTARASLVPEETARTSRRLSSIVATNTCFVVAAPSPPPSSPPPADEPRLLDLEDADKSLTKQDIMLLAMKYSRTVEREEEGAGDCFLVRMLHPKLWRETLVLTLTSLMLETAYYGMIQANKFVGSSVNLNYLIGAAGEWTSALVSTLMMVVLSRRLALVVPVLVASLCCLGMAVCYHLHSAGGLGGGGGGGAALGADAPANTTASEPEALAASAALRNELNFYIMNVGKFAVSIAIQVTSTIQIEAYPSNLRQTAPGAIIFVGRCGSILAPFLFNDASATKWLLQATLAALAALGLLVAALAPFTLRDFKNRELCDHINEIE